MIKDNLQDFVDKQAEDEGIWFDAQTVLEAHLQKKIRDLHTFIECRQLTNQIQQNVIPVPCKYCGGSETLEIRVQVDQKMYAKCICTECSIDDIVRKAFSEGYKRCEDDVLVESKKLEDIINDK